MNNLTLVELQNKHNFNTDKNTRHSYLKHYDELFYPFQNKHIKLLEMGILCGGSLMLWNKYFSNCNLFGVDIDINNIEYDDLWNYSNTVIIPKNFDTVSDDFLGDIKFDIIIDDGSHTIPHQEKALNLFKNKLTDGGILIIEDISSYYPAYNYFTKYIKNIEGCSLLDLRHENGIEDNILLIYKN